MRRKSKKRTLRSAEQRRRISVTSFGEVSSSAHYCSEFCMHQPSSASKCCVHIDDYVNTQHVNDSGDVVVEMFASPDNLARMKKARNILNRRSCNALMSPLVLLLFFTALALQSCDAQFSRDCSEAPNDTMRRICLMLRRMDRITRRRFRAEIADNSFSASNSVVEAPAPPPQAATNPWLQPIPVPANARGQWATNPYDCMTLQCLCPFFGGGMSSDGNCYLASGQPLTMAYRKEYRMMTDNERQRFHYALTVLKQNGEYDRISAEHQLVGAGSGAHSGPGFLPWHREYLKRFEIAIRLIDPSLAIPYWDCVMDGYLPDPRDSVMFSPAFVGETDFNGFLITGPFSYWRTLEGRSTILRQLGREGQLFTEAQLNNVMQQTSIEYVMAYTVPVAGCPYPLNYGALEYVHSNIHLWLGGDMKPPITSANDPIFFLHHSFVDLIFENWRQTRQPRWLREVQYSPDIAQCANPLHFSYAQMRPFYLLNRDGLSNSYTDQMYRYAPRPSCSAERPDCGSPYLYCDLRHGWPHCVAKVKVGGLCSGFEGTAVCLNGQCYFGRCYPVAQQRFAAFSARATRTRQFATANGTNISDDALTAATAAASNRQSLAAALRRLQPFADCYDRNPCCERWAQANQCHANRAYMRAYCAASCKVCTPAYNTTAADECADRHSTCAQWERNGECRTGNALLFMRENCRKSCGFCGTPKCSAEAAAITESVTTARIGASTAAASRTPATQPPFPPPARTTMRMSSTTDATKSAASTTHQRSTSVRFTQKVVPSTGARSVTAPSSTLKTKKRWPPGSGTDSFRRA